MATAAAPLYQTIFASASKPESCTSPIDARAQSAFLGSAGSTEAPDKLLRPVPRIDSR